MLKLPHFWVWAFIYSVFGPSWFIVLNHYCQFLRETVSTFAELCSQLFTVVSGFLRFLIKKKDASIRN